MYTCVKRSGRRSNIFTVGFAIGSSQMFWNCRGTHRSTEVENVTQISASDINQAISTEKNSSDLEIEVPPIDQLCLACREGKLEDVEALISKRQEIGLDINATGACGKTPLSHACEIGVESIVTMLLNHGAEVNGHFPTPFKNFRWWSSTMIKTLIERNAKVDQEDPRDGSTVLHHAAAGGCCECVEILIENNASVNQGDRRNATPLHYACNEYAAVLNRSGHGMFKKNILKFHDERKF